MINKLAIVSRYFFPDVISGRETVIYNLWREAQKHYDVTLISGWRNDSDLLPEGTLKIKQTSNSRMLNYFMLYLQSAKLLRKLQPDVVLSNAIEVGYGEFPSAVIVHDLNFGQADSNRGRNWLRRKIISRQLTVSNKVVAVSKVTKKRVQGLGISKSKITVIHNGVDLDKFRLCEPTGISVHKLIVAYPSRILHGKGQHVAVEAVRSLSKDLRQRVKLVIVGVVQDADYLRELRSCSRDLPVEFAVNVPDIVPYYQQADVVVFPTIMEEGFGYTAVEAMACAKPVICSDYPAIREATGGTGMFVPPGNAQDLANALEELLRNDSKRQELGYEGRTYVEAHYDWDVVFMQYKEVLNELVNE